MLTGELLRLTLEPYGSPWSHVGSSWSCKCHPGAVEAHNCAVQVHPGAVEAHLRAVEADPGAVEAHPGA
jgi:hypothetical protein